MAGDLFAQIQALPIWLQLWLNWMQLILIVVPLFLIFRREAQIIVVAQILNFALGYWVYLQQGQIMTKLFGLGHVFWAIAFVILLRRWYLGNVTLEGRPIYRAWFYAAMATLAVSLPLDLYDVFSYLNGTRQPLWEYYASSAPLVATLS